MTRDARIDEIGREQGRPHRRDRQGARALVRHRYSGAGLKMKSEKLLAQGTLPRYCSPMDETWADLPDFPGYEVSTSGRLRKWTTIGGKPRPQPYRGMSLAGSVYYKIQGESYAIDDLMRSAFGDEADDIEAGYDPRDRDRDLTQYERNEIVQLEGYKPAYEVAEDFRIDAARVRQIWDGAE